MSQFSALLLNAISIWFKKPHLLWFALFYIIFAFAIDPLTNSQIASPLFEFILFFGAMILMLFVHQFIIFGIGRASQNQAFNLEETSFKQWLSFIFFVLLSLPIIAVFGAGVEFIVSQFPKNTVLLGTAASATAILYIMLVTITVCTIFPGETRLPRREIFSSALREIWAKWILIGLVAMILETIVGLQYPPLSIQLHFLLSVIRLLVMTMLTLSFIKENHAQEFISGEMLNV